MDLPRAEGKHLTPDSASCFCSGLSPPRLPPRGQTLTYEGHLCGPMVGTRACLFSSKMFQYIYKWLFNIIDGKRVTGFH